MSFAIAFSGRIGSGKTTVARRLTTLLGWPCAGFGDYVRQVVRERGLPENRENLQKIGTELLESDMQSFCRSVLHGSGWKSGENLLIDGLRHEQTIPIIRDLIRPAQLRVVFISVSDSARLKRLVKRDGPDARNIAEVETHSSERQVCSSLRNHADWIIDGERAMDSIVQELAEWIANLTGR